MNKLLTIEELSAYLPEKPAIATIYSWTSKGLIPFIKKGKKLFFESDVIDLWDELSRPPAEEIETMLNEKD